MKKILLSATIGILFIFSVQSQVNINEWPVFRGKADLSGSVSFPFPTSPRLLWSLPSGGRSKSSPVISDGVIYFGNDKGSLFAVTKEGKIKWKFEAGNAIEAPPFVNQDKVFFGSSDGVLRAVNKLTGKLLWSYKSENQIAGSANMWTSGKKTGLVFGRYDYYLHCVDPASGKLLWKIETENYVNGTPAIAYNSVVFAGCDGIVRFADPVTGREKDTVNIGVYISASPALSDKRAYFGDYDGNLYCLDIEKGKMVWKVPAGDNSGAFVATPAVSSNKVIIGNDDSRCNIYCQAKPGQGIWRYTAFTYYLDYRRGD